MRQPATISGPLTEFARALIRTRVRHTMTRGVMQQRLGATVSGRGKQTVVLTNGIGTSQHTWRHVTAGLESRVRVIRFDNVCSPVAPLGGYREEAYGSLFAYVDDLVGLLDELDVRDSLVVGHSIAGIIGLHAAVAAPERIAHVAAICSAARFLEDVDFVGGFARDTIEAMLAEAQRDYAGWAASFARVAVGPQATEAQYAEFLSILGAMRPDIALRTLQIVLLGDNRALLTRVTQPVTVMQTRADMAIPLSASEYLVQQLPKASLLPIDAQGHVPQLTHPDAVTQAIHQILDVWAP